MKTEVENKISDSEWEVMRVVWAHGQVTSKEIITVLQQKKGWKPATTKTFIGRLVKKGLLDAQPKGRKYLYSAKVSEEQTVKNSLDEFFENICNKDIGKVSVDFISKSTLSHEDVAMLEEVLEKKIKEAVDEVPCNCVPGQCHCNVHQHSGHY